MPLLLDDTEKAAVEAAVHAAESRTSGEIVPYIVRRSSAYPAAGLRAAIVCALTGAFAMLLIIEWYRGWSLSWLFSPAAVTALGTVAGLIGWLLARYVDTVERFFAGQSTLTETVRRRAVQAFVEQEVFQTRERTGILLFVSLFERRVEVIGDAGINKLVEPEDWGRVVEDVLRGIKRKHLAEGLIAAINRCGELLESKGVTIRDDDENELSDTVQFGDD